MKIRFESDYITLSDWDGESIDNVIAELQSFKDEGYEKIEFTNTEDEYGDSIDIYAYVHREETDYEKEEREREEERFKHQSLALKREQLKRLKEELKGTGYDVWEEED